MKICKNDCFARDTKILMSDNSLKSIMNIRVGDMVKTYDNDVLRVKDITTGYEKMLVYFKLKKGMELLVTYDHPVMLMGGEWIRACELLMGKGVCTVTDEFIEIEDLCIIQYDNVVYNLVLDGDGCGVYANGIVAGDFAMQMKCKKSRNQI